MGSLNNCQHRSESLNHVHTWGIRKHIYTWVSRYLLSWPPLQKSINQAFLLKQPLPSSPFIPHTSFFRTCSSSSSSVWVCVVKDTIWLKNISSVIISEFRDRTHTGLHKVFSFLLLTHIHFANLSSKHFHTSIFLDTEGPRETEKENGTGPNPKS